MNQSKLVIFAGPSGTGKTTIVRCLLATNPVLSFSISATTRSKREGEDNQRDYYFLSLNEFKEKIENNEFVEYEEVYTGTYYGTLKSEIERIGKMGKHVIFDIDVVGALTIKKIYGERALSILIMPPSIEVLKQRLIDRGSETPESISRRVGKAEKELAFANLFDYTLINDRLDDAIIAAEELVNNFLNRE